MQVSVVMCAYNAERHIGEAIESVLEQSHKNFELLIVDDGSTDRTRLLAEQYAAQDSRVRIFSHPNMGMGASLNKAIAEARNEWIVRMDADDIMLSNRIERQIAFISQNTEIAVGSSLVYLISESGRVIGKGVSPLTSRDVIQQSVRENRWISLYHPAVIMRKSVIQQVGGYRPRFWPADDLDLWNRVVENGHQVLVQPEFLLKYRVHATSVTVSSSRLTAEKVEYMCACMLSRRRGDAEPSWETFVAERRNAPISERLHAERKLWADMLYKAAVLHFAERKFPGAIVFLSGAALLNPALVFGRIRNRFRGYWAE